MTPRSTPTASNITGAFAPYLRFRPKLTLVGGLFNPQGYIHTPPDPKAGPTSLYRLSRRRAASGSEYKNKFLSSLRCSASFNSSSVCVEPYSGDPHKKEKAAFTPAPHLSALRWGLDAPWLGSAAGAAGAAPHANCGCGPSCSGCSVLLPRSYVINPRRMRTRSCLRG